jgi:hypothetical protein
MAHVIFAVAVVFGSLVFGLPVSRADVATWCALIKGGEYWDCQYRSFEDCYSNVLGSTRGFCNPSPYSTVTPTESKGARKRRPPSQ